MGRMSKEKGKRGEREAAAELDRVLGLTARRGVQYAGGNGSPDVLHDLDGVHIEVKRAETLKLYEALRQATEDAGLGSVPVVMHRRNGQPWLWIVKFEDMPSLALRIVRKLKEWKGGPNGD